LAHMDIEELLQSHGLGPAKATEITAVFEIARRIARSKRADRPQLHTPEAVIELIAGDMAPLRQEELWCLALDSHARLIGEPRMISRGDVDGTDAGPRSIFRRALQLGACQVIVVHNHPSGDATPSDADYAVTKRLAQAGTILDLPLIDHLVIGDGDTYTSIRRSKPALFANQP
ncbi:MAG: DNA repair protein RadC, partial [Planctomycetes bacterium]|nr:DNA repair protein RadC [Planctomycetota bacterium]